MAKTPARTTSERQPNDWDKHTQSVRDEATRRKIDALKRSIADLLQRMTAVEIKHNLMLKLVHDNNDRLVACEDRVDREFRRDLSSQRSLPDPSAEEE